MTFASRCFELLRARQINPATLPAEFHELAGRLALQGCQLFCVPDPPAVRCFVLRWTRGRGHAFKAVDTLGEVRAHLQRLEGGRR